MNLVENMAGDLVGQPGGSKSLRLSYVFSWLNFFASFPVRNFITKSVNSMPLRCFQQRRRGGFTLIELLVVIAVIGILAGMLLPVLSKAKNRGTMTVDINNFKEQTTALNIYTSDNQDFLPWPNWLAGDVASLTPPPGWLYTYDLQADGPARFNIKTGLFWPELRDEKLYMCPMDITNSQLFLERNQQISSYVMNGAVCGYNRADYPSIKLSSVAPDAVAFWETDEKHPNYFNDGASFPNEGVSARHLQGAVNATFCGAVSYIKLNVWYTEAADTNKNKLWCYPNSPDGR